MVNKSNTAKKNNKKKNILLGNVYVKATFNNTIVTVTDKQGNVISWSSAGKKGFKGSKKSTPYAAQVITQDSISRAMERGLKSVDIVVRGPGSGREAALRAIQAIGELKVTSITDDTRYPHNGCRAPKKRRN